MKRSCGGQQLRNFDCTVTSTWVDAENLGECHTWRAWGSRVRKKQLDYMMGPRDLVSTTWYLNKSRIRTWDHFPVVVMIEGREMRVRQGEKKGGRVGLQFQQTRRGNSKNYVSVPKGLAAGAMPMRSVAWRLCKRDWMVLPWRSRPLRWSPGTRTSSWCPKRSGNWRVQLNVVTR